MKKRFLTLALLCSLGFTYAQDKPAEATTAEAPEPRLTAAIDIIYPYLWRGVAQNSPDKIAFQPYVNYAVTDKFTVGIWGSTNLSSDERAYNEFDWNMSYQFTPTFKVTLADYYFNGTKKGNEINGDQRNSYFKYDENSPHSMDLSLMWDFSEKGLPLDAQWNTLIYGNDFILKFDEDENIISKKRAYTSYAEIGYTKTFEKAGIDLRAFVGAVVINKSDYFYDYDENGNGIGFFWSNIGLNASKEIKISKNFSVPFYIRYTFNDKGNIDKLGNNIKHSVNAGFTINIL